MHKVPIVMREGVGFTCAHCERFWWGHARNSACQAAVTGAECAGPLAGLGFPEYKGPLKGNLDKFCFVCGGSPAAIALARGTAIGVCKKHVKMLGEYSRENERPPFISHKRVDIVGGE